MGPRDATDATAAQQATTTAQPRTPATEEDVPGVRPWPALWALVVGFFMILIDTTIVSVANPSIMAGLNADIDSVIWVTSAYLLTYAVPLLITAGWATGSAPSVSTSPG